MARHRMCFIVLTMMLVCLYGSAAQSAVRHGFPPDILFVDYERQGPERSFVINKFADDDSGAEGMNGLNRMKRSATGAGSLASGSAASSVTPVGSTGKDSKNSVRPVIEAKVRFFFS